MNQKTITSLPSSPTTRPAFEDRKLGFAAMAPAKVRELARKGGIAAHSAGSAHEFSSEEARAAGRKGGLAPHARRGHPPGAADVPALRGRGASSGPAHGDERSGGS